MIGPAQFIPLAEQTGLIGELTDRMLLSACSAASGWPEETFLSVNISPSLLRDRGLPGRLRAIAGRTGMSLRRIVLEITESALIDSPELVRDVVTELKALHVRIAQDDFGSGYSSLLQLQALAFDKLKIDSSFIRSMTHQRDSRKIVGAVIGLGLSLGLSTVAEGVETQQQADMLAAMGCDLGQGWWLGRPVPADEAARGVQDGRWNQAAVEKIAQIASAMALRLEASPCQRLAQLQALYDGAPVALGLLDRRLRYISLNRRLAQMHGLTAPAHLGRTVEQVSPKLFSLIEPALRRVLDGETVADLRILWTPANMPGATRLCVASYHPVRDEADEVIGVSIAVIDITDRKDGDWITAAAAEILAP